MNGTWKAYIEALKAEWIGKKVDYGTGIHTIVDVDYNGILHIDLKTKWNDTTAMFFPYEARKYLV